MYKRKFVLLVLSLTFLILACGQQSNINTPQATVVVPLTQIATRRPTQSQATPTTELLVFTPTAEESLQSSPDEDPCQAAAWRIIPINLIQFPI